MTRNNPTNSPSSGEEKECWNKIKQGDKAGLEGLYTLFAHELMSFGLSVVHDRSLVKDCIQELFIEIWRYRRNGIEVNNVKMYVLRALAIDLVPYAIFSPDNQSLQRGNPNLVPTTSMNVDLMFENYYESVGVFTAGGFYKDVNNFIYQRTQLNVTDPQFGQLIELSQPENGGTANLYGFETSIQRQFDFLPGIWKGLGIFANYTFTDSRTTGIEEREGDDIKLPGTARNMFNASLSFETEKLVLRVSVNHASGYLDEVGGSNFEDIYYDRQTFLDINGSYAFTKNWRVFAEANNLTNQPLRYYQGIRERTAQEEFYNARINFGVKFDLFD